MNRLRLGVLCDEVFDPSVSGGYGGFGWLTREILRLFTNNPSLNVDVVPIVPDASMPSGSIHGLSAISRSSKDSWTSRMWDVSKILRSRLDLILSVDYRPRYNFALKSALNVPLVLWVQDPWTPGDIAEVNSLTVPEASGVRPWGFTEHAYGMSNFGKVDRWRRRFHAQTVFAISAPSLGPKTGPAFGIPQPASFIQLPYPIRTRASQLKKSSEPSVLFLGRLDPIKRPWLFVEVARRLPDFRFIMMGSKNFDGPGTWFPSNLPANLEMVGHLDGQDKHDVLEAAWALMSCAIHEGLPVSYVEALHSQQVIIATQDPDAVASRFGRYVGNWPDSGMDAVQPLVEATIALMKDDNERCVLAQAGREWAAQTHTYGSFLSGLHEVASKLHISWRLPSDAGIDGSTLL